MVNKYKFTVWFFSLMISTVLLAASRPMEQCYVVDSNGNSLIKADHADSGENPPNDPNAWIWVPQGACEQINAGDYNGITQDVLDKLQLSPQHKSSTPKADSLSSGN